jgi:RNA polymerase sigma factor (sigma-70 family)
MDAIKYQAAKKLAKWFCSRDPRLASEVDDLTQEAARGMLKAAEKYDPTRGASLKTVERLYAQAYITRYIEARVRKHAVSISSVEGDEDIDVLELCEAQTDTEGDVQRVHDAHWVMTVELPRRAAARFKRGAGRALEMAQARVRGGTLEAIGAQFGVSKERARQVISKLGLDDL